MSNEIAAFENEIREYRLQVRSPSLRPLEMRFRC